MKRSFRPRLKLLAPAALTLTILLLGGPGATSGLAAGDETSASPAASVPPAGGTTTTIAESGDARALLASIPFETSSLFMFDVTDQRWMAYTPAAPEWLNRSFSNELAAGALVWVKRSAGDARPGLTWSAPQALSRVTEVQTLPVPPAGRVTAGTAGTSSLSELINAQSFKVSAVFAFDVARQRYVSYTPGAPGWANSLANLHPSSVVWLTRDRADVTVSAASDAPAGLARVNPQATAASNGPVSPRQPAAAPATAPAARPTGGAPTVAPAPAGGASGTAPATSKPAPAATPAPTVTPAPQAPSGTTGGTAPGMVSGASIFRHFTYEDGEQGMTSIQAPEGGIGRTSEAARLGSKAAFALLQPGDPKSSAGGYRAEYHGSDHTGTGAERWHGISYFFPRDFNQGSNSSTFNDRIIFQFADSGSPMFSLHVDAASEQLWLRQKLAARDANGKPQFRTLGRWDFEAGRWYDVVFHAKWTTDNSGLFELYIDGERRVNYQGRTLAERDVTYSKWGIYGQPTRLLFDELWTAEGSGTLDTVRP